MSKSGIRIRLATVILAAGLVAGCVAQRAQAGDSCLYKGTSYSDGAATCQSGTQYRCVDGDWASLSLACSSQAAMAQPSPCKFAGISFSDGSASCQSGTQFRCDNGSWTSLSIACPAGDAPINVVPSGPNVRTCMYNDATVASSSTICKNGSTFLCNDGEWVNLGTRCR